MYDLCTEELQRKLRINRQEADKAFEQELAAKRAKNSADATPGTSSSANLSSQFAAAAPAVNAAVSSAMEVAGAEDMDEDEALALAQALQMSMGEDAGDASASGASEATSGEKADPTAAAANPNAKMEVPLEVSNGPVDLGNGLPMGFTGQYELHAVVTHKGRSADSGHYIGWVGLAPGSAFWWCYNDDVVTEVRTEDILKLGGGGDRDMAYLNFYRFRENKK